MAYDEDLAERVRAVLPAGGAVTERQMFGGLAFILGGHMLCGVVKDTLMVRLGPDGAARARDRPLRPRALLECRDPPWGRAPAPPPPPGPGRAPQGARWTSPGAP